MIFSVNTELQVVVMFTAFNLNYLCLNYLLKSRTCLANFNSPERQSCWKQTLLFHQEGKFIPITSLWKSENNKYLSVRCFHSIHIKLYLNISFNRLFGKSFLKMHIRFHGKWLNPSDTFPTSVGLCVSWLKYFWTHIYYTAISPPSCKNDFQLICVLQTAENPCHEETRAQEQIL